jgi:hypothetical protein
MIRDELDYPVRIRLRTTDIFDIRARSEEIHSIIKYLDDLTEWHPYMYEIKYLSEHSELDVWFKEEQHAVMCALRWV